MEIKEKMVVYFQDLEGGIFLLKNKEGEIFFPVNLQNDLKNYRGKWLNIEGKAIDLETFQMNGLPIEVIKYSLA